MFERLELLIGKDSLEKISKVNILLVGVGGVGGTCLEALVRSGVQNITIIDGDNFQISNLSNVIITRLDRTSNDPLAKKIRYEARKLGLNLKIPVVCSKEDAISKDRVVASSIFVPSTAGLTIAHYIIEKVINS